MLKSLKKWYKSKTINWSLFIALFGMLELNLPQVRPLLGDYYGLVLIGIAGVNIVLRHLTTKSLEDK